MQDKLNVGETIVNHNLPQSLTLMASVDVEELERRLAMSEAEMEAEMAGWEASGGATASTNTTTGQTTVSVGGQVKKSW